MLTQITRFPDVGSYALLTVPVDGPRGGKAGSILRKVRIVQRRADGRFTVSASAHKKQIGNRMVDVPGISKTVDRSELRDASGSGVTQ